MLTYFYGVLLIKLSRVSAVADLRIDAYVAFVCSYDCFADLFLDLLQGVMSRRRTARPDRNADI